jgi:hypothetical protein
VLISYLHIILNLLDSDLILTQRTRTCRVAFSLYKPGFALATVFARTILARAGEWRGGGEGRITWLPPYT